MNSKSLLIAIAAFAVTATGAQAFTGLNYVERAGLSPTQVEAFAQARELRSRGKIGEARDVLLEAGVDEKAIVTLRRAASEAHEAIYESLKTNDFTAFKKAVEGTPLLDIITTKEDFELFREAHALKDAGKFLEAKEILTDLGLPGRVGMGRGMGMGRGQGQGLTEQERDALRVAWQANDRETAEEISREAGFDQAEFPAKHMRPMRRSEW